MSAPTGYQITPRFVNNHLNGDPGNLVGKRVKTPGNRRVGTVTAVASGTPVWRVKVQLPTGTAVKGSTFEQWFDMDALTLAPRRHVATRTGSFEPGDDDGTRSGGMTREKRDAEAAAYPAWLAARTADESIKLARDWVAVRKQVRMTLVTQARAAHPVDANTYYQPWPSNEVRKLYNHPADLSEERLLKLIDNPAK